MDNSLLCNRREGEINRTGAGGRVSERLGHRRRNANLSFGRNKLSDHRSKQNPTGRSEVDLKIMDLRINTVYETVMITGNMVTKVWGNERGGEVQNTPIWYIGLIKERGLEETKYQRLEDRM